MNALNKFARMVDGGWATVKSDPWPMIIGLLLGAMIYFKWIVHWTAGEWFLAYGILNVLIGFAVVAHHDYTEWKKNRD